MKVLMLGWEFPPFIAGGLGTACYGLTRAMNGLGVDVLFVLPRPVVAHTGAEGVLREPERESASGDAAAAGAAGASVAMVGAAYTFPHAQQAGSTPMKRPDVKGAAAQNGPEEAMLHSPFVGTAAEVAVTKMAYLDFNVGAFEHVKFRTVDAMLSPYLTPAEYRRQVALLEQRRTEELRKGGQKSQEAAKVKKGQGRKKPAAPAAQEFVAQPMPEVVRLIRSVEAPAAAQEMGEKSIAVAASPVMPVSMLSPPVASYSSNLLEETKRYAGLVAGVAREEAFDVIHAHDWMTFRAGVAAAEVSGKPLIVHIHSTEYDRNPHHPDSSVIAIEAEGLEAADGVIAVSHMTRRLLVTRYGVDEEKIRVVHNAIDGEQLTGSAGGFGVRKDEKVVLFLGRMTAQKGPEYFLAAARKVLDVYEPVKFIMAGAGDLMKPTIELAAAMGIGHKVLFTGFLNARDVEKIYQMADLYVMPSVSEPFGIAPLEALSHNVPVIVSKQSGVSEIIKHALKVDFWDIDALADRILAVLRHAPLATTLREHAREEVRKLSWVDAARRVLGIYQEMAGDEQAVEEPVAVDK